MCVLPSISLRRKKITTEVLVQNLKTHIIHLVRCEREHLCNKFVQFGWEECRKYLESNHQNLKSIKLGHNCITSINQLLEIDILSNLSDLDLSYNNIFLLPSHISVKIPQMKRLRVEGNQLTELPRLPPSLVTLIVGSCIKGNQIKNLDLSNLILLKVLYADNNILQRLPLVAHSPVLEILSLSHNQISKLCTKDALPSSVEFIDLSHNLLSNIDEYFFWPKSLNFLNLSNNNLRQIRRDSMARVPILCRLFLSGNDLDGAQTIEEARDYSFFKPKSSKECQKLPMDFDSCKFNKHCSLFELSIKSQSLQLIEDQADFSAVKFNSSRTSILDGKSSENYDYQRLLKKYKDGESSKQYDCEPKEPYQRDHTNRGSQIENDLTSIIDFESTENHHHYDDSQLPPIIECCLRSGKTCANCPVRFFHDYKSICSKAIIRGHPDVSTIERVCSPRCWADLNDG